MMGISKSRLMFAITVAIPVMSRADVADKDTSSTDYFLEALSIDGTETDGRKEFRDHTKAIKEKIKELKKPSDTDSIETWTAEKDAAEGRREFLSKMRIGDGGKATKKLRSEGIAVTGDTVVNKLFERSDAAVPTSPTIIEKAVLQAVKDKTGKAVEIPFAAGDVKAEDNPYKLIVKTEKVGDGKVEVSYRLGLAKVNEQTLKSAEKRGLKKSDLEDFVEEKISKDIKAQTKFTVDISEKKDAAGVVNGVEITAKEQDKIKEKIAEGSKKLADPKKMKDYLSEEDFNTLRDDENDEVADKRKEVADAKKDKTMSDEGKDAKIKLLLAEYLNGLSEKDKEGLEYCDAIKKAGVTAELYSRAATDSCGKPEVEKELKLAAVKEAKSSGDEGEKTKKEIQRETSDVQSQLISLMQQCAALRNQQAINNQQMQVVDTIRPIWEQALKQGLGGATSFAQLVTRMDTEGGPQAMFASPAPIAEGIAAEFKGPKSGEQLLKEKAEVERTFNVLFKYSQWLSAGMTDPNAMQDPRVQRIMYLQGLASSMLQALNVEIANRQGASPFKGMLVNDSTGGMLNPSDVNAVENNGLGGPSPASISGQRQQQRLPSVPNANPSNRRNRQLNYLNRI